jgi:hypothetical protein
MAVIFLVVLLHPTFMPLFTSVAKEFRLLFFRAQQQHLPTPSALLSLFSAAGLCVCIVSHWEEKKVHGRRYLWHFATPH